MCSGILCICSRPKSLDVRRDGLVGQSNHGVYKSRDGERYNPVIDSR